MIVAARARRGAIAATSASSNTTQHDLPPSSSESFFMLSAAAAMIRLPVAVDPVKLTTSTSCDSTSRSPAACPVSFTTLTAPFGQRGAVEAVHHRRIQQTRLRRRFDDARAAGREGRRERANQQHRGRVPRHDDRGDAGSFAQHRGDRARFRLQHVAGQMARKPRVIADLRDRRARFRRAPVRSLCRSRASSASPVLRALHPARWPSRAGRSAAAARPVPT